MSTNATPKCTTICAFFAITTAILLAGCASSDGPRTLSMIKADGNRAMALGQFDRASDFYTQWVERQPFDPEAHASVGKAHMGMARPIAAREQFEIAHDLAPDDSVYLELLAEAMFAEGTEDDLRGLLAEAIEADPSPERYMLLGSFASRMGAPDDAEEAFLAAARIDGGKSVTPQLVLADFYGSIGDRDEQIRRLRMALFLDATNEDAYRRLQGLGQTPGPSLGIPPTEMSAVDIDQ